MYFKQKGKLINWTKENKSTKREIRSFFLSSLNQMYEIFYWFFTGYVSWHMLCYHWCKISETKVKNVSVTRPVRKHYEWPSYVLLLCFFLLLLSNHSIQSIDFDFLIRQNYYLNIKTFWVILSITVCFYSIWNCVCKCM